MALEVVDVAAAVLDLEAVDVVVHFIVGIVMVAHLLNE